MGWFCCLLSVVFVLFQGCDHRKPLISPPAADAPQRAVQNSFFDPNNYSGSDTERINAALKAAGNCGGTVRIGKRKPALQMAGSNAIATLEERDIWVIDSAILIPGNTHLIIDNTTIKLSNICRDNMIRSANCRKDCNTVPPLKNIRITGVGNAVLEGADIPRATGDAGKLLAKPGFTPRGVSLSAATPEKRENTRKATGATSVYCWSKSTVFQLKISPYATPTVGRSHWKAAPTGKCVIFNLIPATAKKSMANGSFSATRTDLTCAAAAGIY